MSRDRFFHDVVCYCMLFLYLLIHYKTYKDVWVRKKGDNSLQNKNDSLASQTTIASTTSLTKLPSALPLSSFITKPINWFLLPRVASGVVGSVNFNFTYNTISSLDI